MTDEEEQQEKRTAAFVAPLPLLKGRIVFDNNSVESFTGATVYVRLDDVTMQDGPSKLILQQAISDVSYDNDDVAGHHQKNMNLNSLVKS
jgi:hypothetical protein